MAKKRTTDLTTGPISSHFKTLAIPAAIGMLFNTLYNVVDIFFAGLLSTDAQAGLALGFQAFYIVMAVGFGLGAAMGALIGNALGQKDARATRRLAVQGISYGAIASVVLMGFGAWFGPIVIAWVSEPGAYREAGQQYYMWLLLALPGFLLGYACNGILQAQGDSLSMQRALMVAFVANIGLNPLLIYGVPGVWSGMGFNGIAASTVISQTGVMLYLLLRVLGSDVLVGLRARNFIPRWFSVREITVQSLPTSFAMLVMFMSGFVVQFALKGFGEHAIAGFGIGIRIEQILLLPVLGITGALLPIASQNYGAQNFDRVRESLFYCWKIGFILTGLSLPILWFGGRYAMALFTDDPEVIRVGAIYLRVDSVILPVYMMLFAINSFLQAMKKPIWTLWIGIYRQGFGVMFFVWIFVGLLNFTEIGVWFGVACAVITGWLVSLLVATKIADKQIGGLWRGGEVTQKVPS
ncbi:MATE family efflux transporter [Cochlodiniinecator piscidefendens]|uniref:MATE family efflux transporter n=1 Tax=Cochlodiniinecator piscidefendens TaxID=2715756 RepID=UPI00140AD8C0|nr:MATE family efflux transporter [Cochlodiniinecator piscidefendens]